MKLYGRPNEEGMLFPVSWWKDVAHDDDRPIMVEGMKQEVGGEMMWCKSEGEFVYTNDSCGNQCTKYAPCNGKNGRCRKLTQGYIGTGAMYRITERGSVRKVRE